MPTKKTLSQLWTAYESQVLPPNCGPVQMTETRRAFYAGAYSILSELFILTSDDEGADVAALDGLVKEAEAVLASMLQGTPA